MIIEVICPFCGGHATVHSHGDVPFVSHTVPTCKEYDLSEDALDFIIMLNTKLGVPRERLE